MLEPITSPDQLNVRALDGRVVVTAALGYDVHDIRLSPNDAHAVGVMFSVAALAAVGHPNVTVEEAEDDA